MKPAPGKALLAVLALAGATALAVLSGGLPQEESERTIELVETVTIRVPPGAREFRLWLPKPASDDFQAVQLLEFQAPWPQRLESDPEFGNETFFLNARSPEKGPIQIQARYHIQRRSQTARPGKAPSPAESSPRGLVAIDEDIRRRAREVTASLADPMAKARKLYRYVLHHMSYDKSGSGWGRGDSRYACKVGKGNCTDFHSLFMALALAEGIPARFRMGFSLPEALEGEIPSPYHCWAEFYAPKRGWVPVDISAAWKNPSRAAYYFGHLDADRVLVSTGREIQLSPAQRSAPLNFLSRPYVEIDGRPFHDLDLRRYYKDVPRRT